MVIPESPRKTAVPDSLHQKAGDVPAVQQTNWLILETLSNHLGAI